MERIKCTKCNGDGQYYDHSDRHYGTGNSESCDEAGCPVQRQCEKCYGEGYSEVEGKNNDYK